MASSSKEVTVTSTISPANDGSLFSEGERVLAFYGPQLYEAKIKKAKPCGKYLIHYLGWNKNWDECVTKDRLLKHNEENLEKQRNLDQKETTTTRRRTKSERLAAETKSIYAAEEKKRKNDDRNNVSDEKLMNIPIPASLKKKLIDDLQNVTQKEKLVKLPRSPNVDHILCEYLEFKTKKDGMITDSVAEILKGIRPYFDKALPVMLLYNKERCQYQEIIGEENISPSTIYGAEHLLRLFAKLPVLLSTVTMEEETWIRMEEILTDFVKFIKKNERKFLLQSAYEGAKVEDGKGKEKEE